MIAIRATRYDPSQCGIFLLNAAVELGKKNWPLQVALAYHSVHAAESESKL